MFISTQNNVHQYCDLLCLLLRYAPAKTSQFSCNSGWQDTALFLIKHLSEENKGKGR